MPSRIRIRQTVPSVTVPGAVKRRHFSDSLVTIRGEQQRRPSLAVRRRRGVLPMTGLKPPLGCPDGTAGGDEERRPGGQEG